MARSPSSTPAFGIARAEHRLRAGLVQQLLEREADRPSVSARCAAIAAAAALRRRLLRRPPEAADGPAREHLRELLHVLLRVAAVDAERVQLEQLARVVLVQPALLARGRGRLIARRASSDRSTGSCRGRRASPDASPTRAPCPRSGRAHAAGWPRARSCRRAARRESSRRPRRRDDSTRTRRGARRTAARSSRARRARPAFGGGDVDERAARLLPRLRAAVDRRPVRSTGTRRMASVIALGVPSAGARKQRRVTLQLSAQPGRADRRCAGARPAARRARTR